MANESFQCLREERERLCVCVCQKSEYLCVCVCVFTGLVVGCLGICVGRRAGADGGVRGGQLARIASHTQHMPSVRLGDKGRTPPALRRCVDVHQRVGRE